MRVRSSGFEALKVSKFSAKYMIINFEVSSLSHTINQGPFQGERLLIGDPPNEPTSSGWKLAMKNMAF